MLKIKLKLKDKSGMTLIEVLTAITILTIFLGCILPLLVSTTRNITTTGEIVRKSYKSNSIMQKLLGNTGANIGYSTEVSDIPLDFKIGDDTLEKSNLSNITGNNLFSDINVKGNGYSTFIADSVTTSMYCYPSHIADDFIQKNISLIATGFKFEDETQMNVYYTDKDGTLREVPNGTKRYYDIEIDRFDAKIATFIIKADNKYINFEHSPIIVQYGKNDLNKRIVIEVDAPTMIMVGEDTKNSVYYVTDGIIDEKGDLNIVRKTIGGDNSESIPIKNSAMNDVQWIPAGEGDDGNGNPNAYGYYAMCGDNGQIRRFWRNDVGNYYWGGDNTIDYTYHATKNALAPEDEVLKLINRKTDGKKGTTVNTRYGVSINPGYSGSENYQNAYLLDGQFYEGHGGLNGLRSYTAFTVNGTDLTGYDGKPISFWTAANLRFGNWTSNRWDFYCRDTTAHNGAQYTNVKKVVGSNATSYEDFWENSDNANSITLTSVGGINLAGASFSGYSSNYPKKNYTLYCGYIPGVIDLWSNPPGDMGQDMESFEFDLYSRWRATLGVAFTPLVSTPPDSFFNHWGNNFEPDQYKHIILNYGKLPENYYSLSGVCGNKNYEKSRAYLNKVNTEFKKTGYTKFTSPLQVMYFQNMLNEQDQTDVSFAYLSHPYAFGDPKKKRLRDSGIDISSDRYTDYDVYQWNFDLGTTIIDIDNMNYEDGSGNTIPISIAVGYTLAGLEKNKEYGISIPTAYNNGVVYLRAATGREEGTASAGRGFKLSGISNIFHQLFYTDMYYNIEQYNSAIFAVVQGKNTKEKAVSAWGWRDKYHPLFVSVYGNPYNDNTYPDKFSYIMGHVMQNKRLTSVRWGATYNSSPEAMWGASDGTLMSWHTDIDNINKLGVKPYAADSQSSWSGNLQTYDYQSIIAEFQSYHNYERILPHPNLKHKWRSAAGSLGGDGEAMVLNGEHISCVNNPISVINNSETLSAPQNDRWLFPWEKSSFWDSATSSIWTSPWGSATDQIGFISPLDTIEDVEFGNDIWVAGGSQGQSYPKYCRKGTWGVDQKTSIAGTDNGSWINVKTWCKQNTNSVFMTKDDNAMTWQAVKISNIENYNIQQVNFVSGIWIATGYYDANNNNQYDSIDAKNPSIKEDEKGVVFFAVDPTKPCGTTNGWKIASEQKTSINGVQVGYTSAYAGVTSTDSDGNPTAFDRKAVGGVNSTACRDD